MIKISPKNPPYQVHPLSSEYHEAFSFMCPWKYSVDTTDAGRVYHIDGYSFPSVTTVAKIFNEKWLSEWKKKVGKENARKISDRATKHGNHIHSLVEVYFQNKPVIDTPNRNITSLLPVLHRIDKIALQETTLWSHSLGMAGRIDLLAEFDGVLSVIDFKTTRELDDSRSLAAYIFQVKTYAAMCWERHIPVEKAIIISSPSMGPAKFYSVELNEKDVDQIIKISSKWKGIA